MPHRDPFEVKLSKEETEQLAEDLVNELVDAQNARSNFDENAKYWMQLYEQQRTRSGNTPWPDAADLTSYLGTEKVDAITARISRTVFTEPIWVVEGWGNAQERAAEVEEFHQWKAEEERLQSNVERALLLSFIDGTGVLEVFEDTTRRMVQDKKNVQLQLDPLTGAPMLNERGEPIAARDENGRLVEADTDNPDGGSIELMVDEEQRIRNGPAYRVIRLRDFYMFPGHAQDQGEVYGYAKRFWPRLAVLKAKAESGFYDQKAVDNMTDSSEREIDNTDDRTQISTVTRPGDNAEKELWEVLILKDLDGKGERWYLVTLHARDKLILRVQKDDLNAKRFVLFKPMPRPDLVYGYSLIGDKLITTIEEHTAWRNMLADKAAMTLLSPIKRQIGAAWDPEEQPLGPKSVIDVRDMREIEPMQMPDITRGPIEREREVLQAGERLAGINDIALGTSPSSDRTLGEVQLVAQQSAVRMDQMTRNVQEAMEDLFQIRHRIWVRTLAEMDNLGNPQRLPASVLTGLENRGVQTPQDGTITADILDGPFRGKPRGSVETAEPAIRRQDFIQFFQMLPAISAANPMIAQALATPEAARSIMSEFVRVFRVENKHAMLAAFSDQGVQRQALIQMIAQEMGRQQGEQPQQQGSPPAPRQIQGGNAGL